MLFGSQSVTFYRMSVMEISKIMETFLEEDSDSMKDSQTKAIHQEAIINKSSIGTDYSYKHEIVWKNAIGFLMMHIFAVYGLTLFFMGTFNINTVLWMVFVSYMSVEGVTIGAHRYYTHKSFKAKPLLQVILLILQTMAGQNCVFIWCRDHRLHHRYSDTDGDPHNAKRGFFFSHIGWLMTKKHPLVMKLGRQIDMSDMQADWMVMFQKKYYYHLYFLTAVFIPVAVPVYYFGVTWTNSLMFCYFSRYIMMLNGTWLVNSAAHIYGTRPYDENLQPVENWFVSFISLGEGWHNYHHAFPWDYKAAELTMHFNFSADIIKFCEKIGLAWDLKTASPELVEKRIMRTGDGTHFNLGNDEARSSVTAIGYVHPLNPSYTSVKKAPEAVLRPEGLPLFHEKDVLNVKNTIRTSATG